MLLDDWLSIAAACISLVGLIGMVFLESFQQPVFTTIANLSELPEGTKVLFKARINHWKPFQEEIRLELSDGNMVSAKAPKSILVDWNQSGVFEFWGKIEQKKPKLELTIGGAKRLD